MKVKFFLSLVLLLPVTATGVRAGSFSVNREKSISVSVGADIVSTYVWRGTYQTGASIQPYLSFDVAGLSLGVWGNSSFAGLVQAPKEVDLSLFYSIKGFSAGLTDYWWTGEGNAYFSAWKEATGKTGNCHYLEASVGYDFGECCSFPLTIGWNTMVYCPFDKNGSDKQRFSTYIDLDYGFSIKGVDCGVGLGITPWEGIYADKFNVMDVSLMAAKTFTIGRNFDTALSVEAIFSPANDDIFLVFGLSF